MKTGTQPGEGGPVLGQVALFLKLVINTSGREGFKISWKFLKGKKIKEGNCRICIICSLGQ